ncbi:MAG TPA: hypothetical protein VGF14_02805 [Alphaproteobacteria bacterium]
MNNSPTNAFIESLDQNPYIDDTTRILAKSAAQEDAATFFENVPQTTAPTTLAVEETPAKKAAPYKNPIITPMIAM